MANIILAGDYKGGIAYKNKKVGLYIYGAFGFGKKKFINKTTVDYYEVLGEEIRKSFTSGVIRGAVGATVAGGIGALAGASSGKKKGLHTVSIVFKDGTKCLCDLDDFTFKNLVVVMY